MPPSPLAPFLPSLPFFALSVPSFPLSFSPWGSAGGGGTQDAVRLLEEKSPLLDEYFMMKLLRAETSATVGSNSSSGGDAGDDDDGDGGGNGDGGGEEGTSARGGATTAAAAAAAGEGEKGKEAPRALCISSLPLLLEGHTPAAEGLPMFLLRLATEVCMKCKGCGNNLFSLCCVVLC